MVKSGALILSPEHLPAPGVSMYSQCNLFSDQATKSRLQHCCGAFQGSALQNKYGPSTCQVAEDLQVSLMVCLAAMAQRAVGIASGSTGQVLRG